MNQALVTFYLLIGLLLRIAVPIAITFFLGWYLRKLDTLWREEAKTAQKPNYYKLNNIESCWDTLKCPPQHFLSCPAYLKSDMPCWEVFQENGQIRTCCQNCTFHTATLPLVFAGD